MPYIPIEIGAPDVEIRQIKSDEIPLLTDFLYEAIFQPDDMPKVPRTVLQQPMIWAYVDRFGARPGDFCHVAVVGGIIVGAAGQDLDALTERWMIQFLS